MNKYFNIKDLWLLQTTTPHVLNPKFEFVLLSPNKKLVYRITKGTTEAVNFILNEKAYRPAKEVKRLNEILAQNCAPTEKKIKFDSKIRSFYENADCIKLVYDGIVAQDISQSFPEINYSLINKQVLTLDEINNCEFKVNRFYNEEVLRIKQSQNQANYSCIERDLQHSEQTKVLQAQKTYSQIFNH